jgi:hypothetical protein
MRQVTGWASCRSRAFRLCLEPLEDRHLLSGIDAWRAPRGDVLPGQGIGTIPAVVRIDAQPGTDPQPTLEPHARDGLGLDAGPTAGAGPSYANSSIQPAAGGGASDAMAARYPAANVGVNQAGAANTPLNDTTPGDDGTVSGGAGVGTSDAYQPYGATGMGAGTAGRVAEYSAQQTYPRTASTALSYMAYPTDPTAMLYRMPGGASNTYDQQAVRGGAVPYTLDPVIGTGQQPTSGTPQLIFGSSLAS